MYNPTTRLLTILELLQSRGEVSGHDLARTLEVEERSIRRYITMLRDIGIPIDGERGRHGGYSLARGFRLPPMMFNAEEITAVMMGLMLMCEVGPMPSLAIESAAAKIERVLPEDVRATADALRQSLVLNEIQFGTFAVPSEAIVAVSRAAHERQCLSIVYGPSGEATARMIAPYGLVLHARAWYVPAYCSLREDMRVFRLDRMRSITRAGQSFTRDADFDARQFVLESLARMPGDTAATVILHAPLKTVQEIIPPDTAFLESSGHDTLMRCYTDDAHWLARYLVQTQLRFTVVEPQDLRDALRELAAEITASLGA